MAIAKKAERFQAINSSNALKGFFGIMAKWGVDNGTARVLIGNPAERTFFEWKKGNGERLSDDTYRRIGYIAGIFKALELGYSNPALADGWVKRPNRFFGGQTPLQRMAAGDIADLAAVRGYVDAAIRAPWS